ncbi:MAG TPA: BrnA antitoxin family protein [Longimicrobium sp.]|jgi:uncharacterized protein (DUF4415 family)
MSSQASDTARGRTWTDDEIDAIADADAEFPTITEDDLARAVAVSAAGRTKVPISIRIDELALEAIKTEGPRYQTRINDLIVAYAQGTVCPLRADVVEGFRSLGGDWLARINDVLAEHLRQQHGRKLCQQLDPVEDQHAVGSAP